MPVPTHLTEANYDKLFPVALDEFPTVINEEHYIDAWLLNSVFSSLLITEQYLLDHKANIEAPAGADVVGDDGQLEISIPAARYSGYETALAWDSNLLEENIKDGETIFGVLGTFVGAAPPVTEFRYVKIKWFSNWGDALVGMSSLWLYDSGATKLNDETMVHTYYGTQVNGTAAEMSNTVTTDYWQLNTTYPSWWKVDLGAVHPILTLKTQAYTGAPTRNFKNFEVWGSEDDTVWHFIYSGNTANNGDMQTFDLTDQPVN
mgnify:FL=1